MHLGEQTWEICQDQGSSLWDGRLSGPVQVGGAGMGGGHPIHPILICSFRNFSLTTVTALHLIAKSIKAMWAPDVWVSPPLVNTSLFLFLKTILEVEKILIYR